MTSRNFEQFLTPLIKLFIAIALVLPSQNLWPPLPLRQWRHLWTTPKYWKQVQNNLKNLLRKGANVFPSVVVMMDRCKCSALHQGIRHLGGQVVGRCWYNVAQVTHPTVVAGRRWTLADYVTAETKFKVKIIRSSFKNPLIFFQDNLNSYNWNQ